MIKEPVHVTDAAFEKAVLGSSVPVIVDFWAPWCGPCKTVAPSLQTIASEYKGRVLVAKVNTDENPEWAAKYGVQGIPTILFVVNGQAVGRLVGAYPYANIKGATEKVLAYAAQAEAEKGQPEEKAVTDGK